MSAHIYNGECPDDLQPDARDPDCPACAELMQAQAWPRDGGAGLLPCPFCGSHRIGTHITRARRSRGYQCMCLECRVRQSHALHDSPEQAAQEWNRRAGPSLLLDEIRLLRERNEQQHAELAGLRAEVERLRILLDDAGEAAWMVQDYLGSRNECTASEVHLWDRCEAVRLAGADAAAALARKAAPIATAPEGARHE